MIRVDRNAVPEPSVYESPALEAQRRSAARFFVRPRGRRTQRRFDWRETFRILRGVDGALRELFHAKCAYCESPLHHGSGELTHFRPTEGAMNHDGATSASHYWWLAFEWSNLLLACNECVQHKGKRFPVRKRRAKADTSGATLRREEPLLLDPCADDCAEHLAFSEDGSVVSMSERGRITIEILGLNRSMLRRARAERIEQALSHLNVKAWRPDARRSRELVSPLAGPQAPFAGAVRQILARWSAEHPGELATALTAALADLLGVVQRQRSREEVSAARLDDRSAKQAKEALSVKAESAAAKKAYFSGARRIERVEIRNFRGIRTLTCEMPSGADREGWLVLLGENGCGKSTVLQGIALALMGQKQVNRMGLVARDFFNHDPGNREDEGFVRVTLTNLSAPVELKFSKYSKKFAVTPPTELVLLMGYGATRLLPRSVTREARDTRYVRVKNLFNPYARLQDAEGWLTDTKNVTPRRFGRIARALKELLMLDPRDSLVRRRRKVLVKHGRREYRLAELSDGFQSVIALAMDIIIGLGKWDDIAEAEGVVLLDEIEVHLHPRWKMEIVTRLRRAFPKLSFFVTTHDPLCLRGLEEREVVVMRRDARGVHAEVVTQPIGHLRADQLLTSPLFGLIGTRDPVAVRRLAEAGKRYDELFMQERSAEEEDEFRALGEQIRLSTPGGETSAETDLKELRAGILQEIRGRQLPSVTESPLAFRHLGRSLTALQQAQFLNLLDRA